MIKHKMYYDNQREWKIINSFVSTEGAIQAPFSFYYINNKDWSSSHNWDYWNINFTSAASINNTLVIKTIYDPAVSGFAEPKTTAFTGFTYTGGNTSNSSLYNVKGNFTKGWNFYTQAWKTGDLIFFEAYGFRYTSGKNNGRISFLGEISYCWTAGTESVDRGINYASSSGLLNPQDNDFRSSGITCRPVLE